MIAVEVAQPAPPVQAIVKPQLDTRGHQPLAQAQGKRQAAIVIEQAAHPHAALGGLHQRLDHGLGTRPRLHQIELQFDLLLGAGNRHQHSRKELRTVDQQLITVAVAPGEHCAAHVSAP
ncbi:hypothetical protein D3C84_330710 [compost metagenome]